MEVISLIKESAAGNRLAMNQLFDLVYDDLKQLSRKIRLNWRNEHTLNTTALVHEAYLKVQNTDALSAQNKLHFYRICGQAMKYILQDHLKQKSTQKKGSGQRHLEISNDEVVNLSDDTLDLMEDIFHNIEKLQEHDPVVYEVIECRFFADMSVKETSELLSISPATVKRKWSFAKAYISSELKKTA